MPISFASSLMLESIGLPANDMDAIADRDIFTVLAEYTSSPEVNKEVKQTILEKITAGEPVRMDLMARVNIPTSGQQTLKHSRNGSMLRGAEGEMPSSVDPNPNLRPRSRLSGTLDRGADMLSDVLSGLKMRKLVSHWAPLKDEYGNVSWVVLILTPALTV